MKFITPENLSDYAFLNEDTLKLPLKGVCVCFHGYTDATTYDKSPKEAEILGAAGIAWVFPYYSVWAWMSSNSQEFNEQVIDAVYEKLDADEHTPLIITGGSMGGMTALNYVLRGKHKADGCALNCPLTDMEHFFISAPGVRRAILSAHIEKQGDLMEILREYSPINYAQQFPKIPYYWVYGEKDEYFARVQMPQMKERMDACGVEYELCVVPEMGHCAMDEHPQAHQAYCDFIIRAAEAAKK